jgi:hypothetical protein
MTTRRTFLFWKALGWIHLKTAYAMMKIAATAAKALARRFRIEPIATWARGPAKSSSVAEDG